MVKIRLTRSGSKKNIFYKIIVTDSRNPRDGKFIENLGFFDPKNKSNNQNVYFNLNRINYWINIGAIVSKRVSFILKKNITKNSILKKLKI
ncbi:MAG: 30S ribosomal protein S16 [Candidatus Makana argininalis]